MLARNCQWPPRDVAPSGLRGLGRPATARAWFGRFRLDWPRRGVHGAHLPIDRIGDLLRGESEPLFLRVVAARPAVGFLEKIAHAVVQTRSLLYR
jgi:hypothetical protein